MRGEEEALFTPRLSRLTPAPTLWWSTCPFRETQNLATVFRILGRGGCCSIRSFFLNLGSVATTSCSSAVGLVWREGEYAYLGGLRQTCSKVAALILHRCTFWVCCSVFFSSPRPSLRAGKATTLFSRHTKAIIWGMQTRAVQGMLDFDYICSRDEPSVAAMVYPFT